MAEPWPKWLSPEYTAIHTAIYNEMVKALEHCYESADAAGQNWTTTGWLSVSASNIVGLLQQAGVPPPQVGQQKRLSVEEVHRRWHMDDDNEGEKDDG